MLVALAESGDELFRMFTKQEARKLIDELPEGASWEDLMQRMYVRETIEAGLADSDHGRVKDLEEIRAKYGLA